MNPFELNVADLRRSRATEREVEISATVDWGLELSRIALEPAGGPNLLARLMLTPVGGGLMAHGLATFTVRHSCHRCLDEWTEEMEAPISAMFAPASSDDDDETFPLSDVIDLEPAVRDDVLLAMPLSPTCPDGCRSELVAGGETGLNTTAPADENSADGIPEDSTGETSPFAVLRDLLERDD